MKLFYFTSTGNTLYIAKQLGGDLYSIPGLIKNGSAFEYESDKIGILFPCYAFGVPEIVEEFVTKAKFNSDYCFAIMTYGNMSSAALNCFNRIVSNAGIKLSYLNEIRMVDNYLPLFEMAAQKKGAPKKKIEDNLKQIIEDVHNKRVYIKKSGFANDILTRMVQHWYKKKHGTFDVKYTVEENCNGCKICAAVCPVNNIRVDGKPEFLNHCIECFGCTHHCPQNAIRVKGEKSRERFKNEHVTVKEIIEANSTH